VISTGNLSDVQGTHEDAVMDAFVLSLSKDLAKDVPKTASQKACQGRRRLLVLLFTVTALL